MSMRGLLKDLTPPVLARMARRWRGRGLRFSGRPASWQEACATSGGYAESSILDKVAAATRAVIAGQAVFERDSVLFHEAAYPYPVLAALLRAAACNGGVLEVVDFGGSLGSTYRQCRPFLANLARLRWQVVEQAAFVRLGRAEFTTEELSFAPTLQTLNATQGPPVLLAGSVLQYLESPWATLDSFSAAPAAHLVIDRLPICTEATSVLCIQHAPSDVYKASYPSWIFSRSQLQDHLARHWRTVSEFPCEEGDCSTDDGLGFAFRGLILERRA